MLPYQLRRRDFITLVGGAATAWPLAARAQQSNVPIIGFLNSGSPEASTEYVAAFNRGLNETGYVDGRNVRVEFRWADGRNDRLRTLAAELIRSRVSVLVAVGGSVTAVAAKAETTTVPIVFAGAGDPVALGLIISLNRPGGNATGAVLMGTELGAKRLELLRELVPNAGMVAVLVNPSSPNAEFEIRVAQNFGRDIRQQVYVTNASAESDFERAFLELAQQHVGAVSVASDAFFNSRRNQLVSLAGRHAIPAIYDRREFVDAGGLISYGTPFSQTYHQVGIYTGRILNGEKPADLPVVQPTKFELVINLKTAKMLGLTLPPSLIAVADDVIE